MMDQEQPKPAKRSSDVEMVFTSFLYPFCKQGLSLILAVGIISVGLQLLQNVTRFLPMGGMLSGILKAMLWGSILGYVLHVITKTADGENTPPDWQSISDWSDILRPIFLLLGTVIFSFGPAIGWSVTCRYGYVEMYPVFWFLVVWGCFYFPMALTAVAMMDNLSPLNPASILVSIFRTGWMYVYVVIILVVATTVTYCLAFLLPRIPYLTTLISSICLMYLLMVLGRICGLIYCLRREKLNWLCE